MSMYCGKHGIPVRTRCAICDADDASAVIEQLQQRIAAAERQCEWALAMHAYPPTRMALQSVLDALRDDIQGKTQCERDKPKK